MFEIEKTLLKPNIPRTIRFTPILYDWILEVRRDEQNELIQKLDLAVSFCKSERMGIYDIAKLT